MNKKLHQPVLDKSAKMASNGIRTHVWFNHKGEIRGILHFNRGCGIPQKQDIFVKNGANINSSKATQSFGDGEIFACPTIKDRRYFVQCMWWYA